MQVKFPPHIQTLRGMEDDLRVAISKPKTQNGHAVLHSSCPPISLGETNNETNQFPKCKFA